jgi:LDH2 family malate/lactate/ureidoglycolate dehydrogenase
MPPVPVTELRPIMRDLLIGVGTSSDHADQVTESLVDANLAGHDSHGVLRILHYLEMAGSGEVIPGAEAEVIREFGATTTIDGHWGWGQPSMWLATKSAGEHAQKVGIGAAIVVNSYHIGRVAPYVEHLARQGLIAIAMSNAGRAVAPFGSRQRVMGTNPIAWAVPGPSGAEPICLDIATAFIAEGKVRVARAREVEVPDGAVIDSNGYPSVNPNDFYNGGALLAFGAHKGSGLSILAQLLGAGLMGATADTLSHHRGGNGPIIIALSVEAFADPAEFTERVAAQAAEIRKAQPAVGFDQVHLPGDLEFTNRINRERNGVPVPDSTWAEIQRLHRQLANR